MYTCIENQEAITNSKGTVKQPQIQRPYYCTDANYQAEGTDDIGTLRQNKGNTVCGLHGKLEPSFMLQTLQNMWLPL
jgi:hypothetical protein